jgi:hypothetical protein
MKIVHWIAAGLVALASVSAFAAAGGNGGGNGGAGHGGVGGNAGGMSAGHMSSKGVSNTNGFSSADRDAALPARRIDRTRKQIVPARIRAMPAYMRGMPFTPIHARLHG